MGFLSLFSKSAPAEPTLLRLPTGSFTVDREGSVLVGTLPSSFPQDMIAAIAEVVLQTFREATDTQLLLSEIVIQYPSLRISARELRGGAIIYLSPRSIVSTAITK